MLKILTSLINRQKEIIIFFFLSPLIVSCATYQQKINTIRINVEQKNYEKAISDVESLISQTEKDKLVYLYDYGTILQIAKKYNKSNEVFEEANSLAAGLDYHSISKQALSLVLNEEQIQYKGEVYEKILVHAMMAINFLVHGLTNEAIIEARRINEKYLYYKKDRDYIYEVDQFFPHYLSAVIWEAGRNWDDAFIDYKRAYETNPDFPYIKEDLQRLALLSGRKTKLIKRSEKKSLLKKIKKNNAQVILIYQQGWGPRKQQSLRSSLFAELYPVGISGPEELTLQANQSSAQSIQLMDVDHLAIKTYNSQIGTLIAKRVAALAAKEILRKQINDAQDGLGSLLYLGSRLAERADLRQWSTLPKRFKVARLHLPPGAYDLSLLGNQKAEPLLSEQITLKPNEVKVLTYRSF